MPRPKVINAWIREHMPKEPMRVRVVELREISPPEGCQPVRWVLYTTQAVNDVADAERVIGHYEQRPTIEDYHKCFKTGCRVEMRQYETAERLERVAGTVVHYRRPIVANAYRRAETPARPAHEVAPQKWVEILRVVRKIPASRELTIRDFVRQLGGLGGHMLRKCDGEPGWITLWRGYEKLQLLLRGADALGQNVGNRQAGKPDLRIVAKRQMPLPVGVVGGGEIGADMHAAGFFALERRGDHHPGDDQHVLQFPAAGVGELPRQHVAAPVVDVVGRFGQFARRRGGRRPLATSGS